MKLIKAIAKFTIIGVVVYMAAQVVLFILEAIALFFGSAFFVALIMALFGI